MRLKSEIFYDNDYESVESQLTDFVNENKIDKADIQSIIFESKANCLVLFYWNK